MSTINDGGPAFPNHPEMPIGAPGEGMTLRDYFAAKAMQGMVAAEYAAEFLPDLWSLQAYKLADAMLNARKIVPQP